MTETTRRPRAARAAAALVAALLALTAGAVLGAPAPAGAQTTPTPGLLWKMSEQAWTSSSLAPAHATAAPATKTTDGFSFPTPSATSFDPATGAGTATFAGSFDLGNTNQGNYRIRVANPTVILDAGGTDGRINAAVSYALYEAATSTHVWSTPVTATVADLTFASGDIVDSGNFVSFTTTPDFVLRTDLTPENNPNEFRQFPQPFLDAIAPAVPSLLGHFRQTAAGQPAKAPSPVTVGFPYTPAPPASGLTWKVSDQAWTSSSLAPAHGAEAPAFKSTGGFAFPETTFAEYDPVTGVGRVDFSGSLDLGNLVQGNYRIRIANPTLVLEGTDGALEADVSYALYNATTMTHDWSTPVRAVVADLTVPTGAVTVAGGALSLTITPDFDLRTDLTPENNPNSWKQFPQTYLDAIAPAVPSLLGHFRQTGAGSDALKAPATITVTDVAFTVPDPSEEFIEHLYQTTLGRSVDGPALEFWLGRLTAGTSRQGVTSSVTGSAEARNRLVRVLYPTTVGRAASASEVTYWAGQVAGGMTAENLTLNLLGSPEAYTRWGGNGDGLAAAAYQHHLGRAGDAGGVEFWAGRLDDAGSSAGRKSVLRSFGRTAEATGVAVTRSVTSACASTSTLTPEARSTLATGWVNVGRNPVRHIGSAVMLLCQEGNLL